MILPLMLLAGFGVIVAAKSKPKTAMQKRQAFGPRSGETWDVEDFPDARLLVVHSRRGDGTLATFHADVTPQQGQTPPRRKFRFNQGKGSPTLIAMMREDFEGESPPV